MLQRIKRFVAQPFFWNKLETPGLGTTVWAELQDSEITLDLKDLEDTFSLSSAPKASPSQPAAQTKKKQAPSTLLDITRAQNIGGVQSCIDGLKLIEASERHHVGAD